MSPLLWMFAGGVITVAVSFAAAYVWLAWTDRGNERDLSQHDDWEA